MSKAHRLTVIGLPGAGKTTVMEQVGARMGLPVLETDSSMLRPVRKQPGHPVMQSFAAGFAQKYGQPLDITLLPKTADFMATYGTAPFRDFEEQLFIHSMRNGHFDGALPDLGGSIFLREGAREALREQGIVSVYMDVPEDIVVERLMQGFEEGVRDPSKIRRSNYHFPALESTDPEAALRAMSRQHRAEREPLYRLADHIVSVTPGMELQDVVDKVIKAAHPPAPAGNAPKSPSGGTPAPG